MGQPPAAPGRRKLCSVANPTSSKLRQERHGACLKTPWGHAARDFGRAQHPPARLRFTNLQPQSGGSSFFIPPSSFPLSPPGTAATAARFIEPLITANLRPPAPGTAATEAISGD